MPPGLLHTCKSCLIATVEELKFRRCRIFHPARGEDYEYDHKSRPLPFDHCGERSLIAHMVFASSVGSFLLSLTSPFGTDVFRCMRASGLVASPASPDS